MSDLHGLCLFCYRQTLEDCWLLQRKDARGGNCQMSGGLAQGWCSILCGCSERESSGQRQGHRGFHSLHPRDSGALLSLERSGLCQGCRKQRETAAVTCGGHKWALWHSWLCRGFHVHPVGRQRSVLFHFAKMKTQASARCYNL